MTVHVIISGNVQGVGFRQYIKYQAKKLNIKGWVKNLPDGRVEAVLTGDTKSIEEMLEYCRKGPFLARVKNVDIENVEEAEYESFEIIKD